jgi:hypothetical protein
MKEGTMRDCIRNCAWVHKGICLVPLFALLNQPELNASLNNEVFMRFAIAVKIPLEQGFSGIQ